MFVLYFHKAREMRELSENPLVTSVAPVFIRIPVPAAEWLAREQDQKKPGTTIVVPGISLDQRWTLPGEAQTDRSIDAVTLLAVCIVQRKLIGRLRIKFWAAAGAFMSSV
ncbi:hypothetical protein ACIPF8_19950 [Collimonas sp. NPDC087041]|uniref:hypothetical protein n=1 Tax=Collimonas sp. NPDC087041 TaxID=3363960 RepID=UPI0037FFF9EA